MDGHEQSGRAFIAIFIPVAGFALAVLAGCAAALAGFGHRWGWWHYRTGFAVLKAAAYIGIAAAAISLAGLIGTRPLVLKLGAVLSLAGMLAGLFVAGIPWTWLRAVKQVPAIHDISTDTEDPPKFAAVLPLRKDAANPAEHGGSAIAAMQRESYPDIVPHRIKADPGHAFKKALQAARAMGWEIVDTRPGELCIEATDTTFWFGFKDDVVIRVTPEQQGSRVDVRSLSRVGSSDVGTNAKRIRAYLKKLDQMK